MRGRKPKPTEMKVLQGTFRKDRANPHEPKPDGVLSQAPKHLTAEQAAIWDEAIAQAPAGMLKPNDWSVLAVWVVAAHTHMVAAEKVRTMGQLVKAPSGYPIQNPYLSSMNKQASIMMKAASELGFTPVARSRVVLAQELSKDDPWAEVAAL
mgnify:FL=1